MEFKKVFISQPMRNKTDEEIKKERENIISQVKDHFGEDVEIIDSFKKELKNNNPVYSLGTSLQMLSEADLAVFAKGWNEANGCSIEHKVCENYGIAIWEL